MILKRLAHFIRLDLIMLLFAAIIGYQLLRRPSNHLEILAYGPETTHLEKNNSKIVIWVSAKGFEKYTSITLDGKSIHTSQNFSDGFVSAEFEVNAKDLPHTYKMTLKNYPSGLESNQVTIHVD